jgi:hypothetical protein
MNKRQIKEYVALIFDFGSEAEKKCINNQAFRTYRKLIVEQYADKLSMLSSQERDTQ